MKRTDGFTLIELMITVGIVAILASIAVPAYQDQIAKARRVDGESLLLDIAQQEERFQTANSTYTTDMNDLGYSGYYFYQYSEDENYIALVWPSGGCLIGDCFRLLAIPLTYTQTKDGYLVLWSSGRRQRWTSGGGWKEGWE